MASVGSALRIGGPQVDVEQKVAPSFEELTATPVGRSADLAVHGLIVEVTGTEQGRAFHDDVTAKVAEGYASGKLTPGREAQFIKNAIDGAAFRHQVILDPEERMLYERAFRAMNGPAGARHLGSESPKVAPRLPGDDAVRSACRSLSVATLDSQRAQVEGHKIALAAAISRASDNIVKARVAHGASSPEYRQAWNEYQNVRARLNVDAYDHYRMSYKQAQDLLNNPPAMRDMALRHAKASGLDLSGQDPKARAAVDSVIVPDYQRRCEAVVRQYEKLGFAPGPKDAEIVDPDTGKPVDLFCGWKKGQETKAQLSELGLKEAGFAPIQNDLDAKLTSAPAPTRPGEAMDKTVVPSIDMMEPSPEMVSMGLNRAQATGQMDLSREQTFHTHAAPVMAHSARNIEALQAEATKLSAIKAAKFLGMGLLGVAGMAVVTSGQVLKHSLDPNLSQNPFNALEAAAKTPVNFWRQPGVQHRFTEISKKCEQKGHEIGLAHCAEGEKLVADYRNVAKNSANAMQRSLPGGFTPQQLHGFEVSTQYLVGDSLATFDAALRRHDLSAEKLAAMPRQDAMQRIRDVANQEIQFLSSQNMDPDGSGRAAMERGAMLYQGYARDLNSEENLRLRLEDLGIRMEAIGIASQDGAGPSRGATGLSATWCASADQLHADLQRIGGMPAGPARETAYRDLWEAMRNGKGMGMEDRRRVVALASGVDSEFMDGYAKHKAMSVIQAIGRPEMATNPDDVALASRPDVRTMLNTTAVSMTAKPIDSLAKNADFLNAFQAKWEHERQIAASFARLSEESPAHAAALKARGLDPVSLSTMIDTGEAIGGSRTIRNVGSIRMMAKAGVLDIPKGMRPSDLDAGNPIGYASVGDNLGVGVMIGYRQPQGRVAEEVKLHFMVPPSESSTHDFKHSVTISGDELKTMNAGELRRTVAARLRESGFRGTMNDNAVLGVMNELKTASNESGRRTLLNQPNSKLWFPDASETIKPSLQEAFGKGFNDSLASVRTRYTSAMTFSKGYTLNPLKMSKNFQQNAAMNDLISDHDGVYASKFSKDWNDGHLNGMAKMHADFARPQVDQAETEEPEA